MREPEVRRAVAAAMWIASSLGLQASSATVLHSSNKLTLRLRPCDVVARVAPVADQIARFEVDLAQQLLAAGCPVAALEPRIGPRVYERDELVVTFSTYYEATAHEKVPPVAYAQALARLHAGMRPLDVAAPHFTARAGRAQQLVASRDETPELSGPDRDLLAYTLRVLTRRISEHDGAEQLLHGEPHPGNLLMTTNGPLFIDFETCCRGPVELDLAHAPDEVAEHYPGIDRDLLRDCRMLVLAMITTWRWERGDQLLTAGSSGPGGSTSYERHRFATIDLIRALCCWRRRP